MIGLVMQAAKGASLAADAAMSARGPVSRGVKPFLAEGVILDGAKAGMPSLPSDSRFASLEDSIRPAQYDNGESPTL